MSLRFFADQCVPSSIVRSLSAHGHQVIRLADRLPIDAPDTAVIQEATTLKCLLLSLNGDFADIVAYPPERHLGIISIQLRNHPEAMPALIETLVAFLALHPDMDDYRGILLLVEAHRIRIRR